ncbi:TPA: DHA2 family efflux MFS transporter permease subunit [Citrobacter koseri]|uniref:DHA2 family efflux MFS transporter permease subunit n=1 Tax=Citrobacter TaxID=544 RepID=UPI000E062E37|nr:MULTISPECIES: DHA2 family efflux MFS transporter permease subunit [Citrobacter]MCE5348770.1 DHA2 family efflux MFS transporter permease subunit [Citrobacter koseri]MDM3026952.1 DHA2 family efflux MFS transporter permease subunit [Citrobacter sp. CK194]STA80013.1 multidrug resistance protein B [Citrobacter koseri]STT21283.1 multidrug resistance protein B [Citrobacter koseri]HCC5976337.1 DHA2 family efflux MFS transporter permease subunit [Citrobacter koseri]
MSRITFPHLTGVKLIVAAIALSLGNFMVVLDTTITNVAMPTISGYLGVSTTEGIWIITAYAVAEAITVPLTGWIASQFGQVRTFLLAIIAFVLFSVCCGLSWSLTSLTIFRVLQGLAGGPLIPLSATLLIAVFPKSKSNIAVALWGMMTVIAPIFGPILGGVISDNWSWQWVFYINIAFGFIVGCGAWWVLKDRETLIKRSRLDRVGLSLLILFVSTFQITLDKGRELDWFSSSFIIICSLISLISLILLIIWVLNSDAPIIDLRVFKSRNWLVSTIALCMMFGIFFGNIVLTPLWLQQWMGYTATWAGYATSPMGILAVLSSPIIGRMLPKFDPRLLVSYGMGMLAVSFVMRSFLTTQADFMSVALPMVILGAGVPACLITLTSLGVSQLPTDQVAAGAGLQNFLRVMSMAIGSSLTQTYWEHMSKFNRSTLVSSMQPDVMTNLNALAAQNRIPLNSSTLLLSKMVDEQAVMLATNNFYQLATLLMLCSISIIWFIKKTEHPLHKNIGH